MTLTVPLLSLEWLHDAARSALEQARDRMRHEREAETQRVHLGLGVDVERDLNPSIDRDPSPPDVTHVTVARG